MIMKRIKLNKYVGMLAIIIALATTTSLAQHGRGGQGKACGQKAGHGQGQGKGCVYHNIPDLTDEQKLEIDKIKLEQKKEALEVHAEMDVKRAKLKTLLIADNPDKAEIDALIDEMNVTRTAMQKKHAETVIKIRKILTEEQRVHFDNHLLSRAMGHGCGIKGCMGFCQHKPAK